VVGMKISVLWDKMGCNPVKFDRRFGETFHLHLQGRKVG
jgi:hypothetical protein